MMLRISRLSLKVFPHGGLDRTSKVVVVGNQNDAWKIAWERVFLAVILEVDVSFEVVHSRPEATDAWICSQMARSDDLWFSRLSTQLLHKRRKNLARLNKSEL